jgi:hypothetical protein
MTDASEGETPSHPIPHTMKKLFAAAFAALAIATPAQASTADVRQLMDLIKQTGTTISFNTNRQDSHCINNAGYYYLDHDSNQKVKTDLLVICRDQVDLNNADKVWEALSHEATHIMQACTGDTAFTEEDHPTMFRELNRKAPHYSKLVDNYHGRDARYEAEAFWMELHVIGYFKDICFKKD